MKKYILYLLLMSFSVSVNAQFFSQDFNASTVVTDYANDLNPTSGMFNALTTTAATSPPVTVSITNGALRFNRTAIGTIFAYRNFAFDVKPNFVQLKMDFEASGNVVGTQTPVFNVFVGSAFSSASTGMASAYASRFGIVAEATPGDFRISTVDNIGGAPLTAVFSGKQTLTFVVNNSGVDQTYTAPNGSTETVGNGKMDVWIGQTKGINDFSLKNTSGTLADISGFKIQATSQSGTGVYDFDNIEFKDLLSAPVVNPGSDLPDTPTAYLALKHPFIWASYPERQNIVNNIKQYKWASSMYSQLKARVDANKNTHKINPSAILSAIPAIPGVKADRAAHNNMLTSASEAAILYYLTDDPDYAQYASDILSHYTDRLSSARAIKYTPGTTGILFSDWWLESRALYPKIAIVYDFVYDYANNPANTVFDLATNSRRAFNNTKAQTTVQTLATIVFESVSAPQSNHSVLAGNGALFNLLMIDDNTKRDTFFNYFYNDPQANPFDAYTWTLANFTSQNIWDETLDYSKYSQELVLQSLNVIDRYKPELNIITNNKRIFDGFPFYENYFYPSGEIMRFGDTDDEVDLLYGYQRMLKIATRKNMTSELATTKQILKFEYNKRGGNNPIIATENLEWSNPLQLLWGENVEDTVTPKAPVLNSTVPVQHAGLVIQRNYNTTNVKTNGLMYYSGGAPYVHAHRSGINLELYGKGYVLGAESGSGAYTTDEHDNYRKRLAAHNTVIANGSGLSGSNWATTMNTVSLVSSEPKANVNAISNNFSFATQFINDTYNKCLQQRTNSIVRTSETTGYYFDIARSKGNTTNNFHDYIYHNIGDAVALKFTDNTSVPLSASTKYAADTSTNVTGWKFFESVNSSTATNQAVNAKFSLNTVNKFMNVVIPGGISREYATALAPTTKGALNGYDVKKTPVMTMRKIGEAWDQPFIAIFEPTDNQLGTVKSATTIFDNTKAVGVKVVSEINGQQIIDIILSNDSDNVALNLPQYNISFTGRFAIVRTEVINGATTDVSLYIGRGQQLVFIDKTLNGDVDGKGYLEYSLNYALSTLNFSQSTENLVVFPNPTNGIFEIKNLPLTISTIKLGLYSIDSKLIETTTYPVTNGSVKFDISDKEKGIYFVKGNSIQPFFVKIIKN
jgi:Secretion system C-terminal sorting domain/Heparinase II/III-like protein